MAGAPRARSGRVGSGGRGSRNSQTAPRTRSGSKGSVFGGFPLILLGLSALLVLVGWIFLSGQSLVAGRSLTASGSSTTAPTSAPPTRAVAAADPATAMPAPPTATTVAKPATPTAPAATATHAVAAASPTKAAVATATATRAPASPTAAPRTSTPTVAPTKPTPAPTAAPSPTPTAKPAAPAATATSALAPPTAVPVAKPASAGVVALTFDAGADRGYAEDILDRLEEAGIKASFGMTGTWAKANPALVQRMAADGHLMINHTLDHRSFTGLSDNLGGLTAAQRRAELDNADAIIAPLIGHSTKPWYRLPYGDDDARVASDVAPAGYTMKAGWTIDSLGWRGITAAEIIDRCLKLAAPNAVYIMHVGRDSQDGPALKSVIDGLRARGYGFVTMANLPG